MSKTQNLRAALHFARMSTFEKFSEPLVLQCQPDNYFFKLHKASLKNKYQLHYRELAVKTYLHKHKTANWLFLDYFIKAQRPGAKKQNMLSVGWQGSAQHLWLVLWLPDCTFTTFREPFMIFAAMKTQITYKFLSESKVFIAPLR